MAIRGRGIGGLGGMMGGSRDEMGWDGMDQGIVLLRER